MATFTPIDFPNWKALALLVCWLLAEILTSMPKGRRRRRRRRRRGYFWRRRKGKLRARHSWKLELGGETTSSTKRNGFFFRTTYFEIPYDVQTVACRFSYANCYRLAVIIKLWLLLRRLLQTLSSKCSYFNTYVRRYLLVHLRRLSRDRCPSICWKL